MGTVVKDDVFQYRRKSGSSFDWLPRTHHGTLKGRDQIDHDLEQTETRKQYGKRRQNRQKGKGERQIVMFINQGRRVLDDPFVAAMCSDRWALRCFYDSLCFVGQSEKEKEREFSKVTFNLHTTRHTHKTMMLIRLQ